MTYYEKYKPTGIDFVDRVVKLQEDVYKQVIPVDVARVGRSYLAEEYNRVRLITQLQRDNKRQPKLLIG